MEFYLADNLSHSSSFSAFKNIKMSSEEPLEEEQNESFFFIVCTWTWQWKCLNRTSFFTIDYDNRLHVQDPIYKLPCNAYPPCHWVRLWEIIYNCVQVADCHDMVGQTSHYIIVLISSSIFVENDFKEKTILILK